METIVGFVKGGPEELTNSKTILRVLKLPSRKVTQDSSQPACPPAVLRAGFLALCPVPLLRALAGFNALLSP